MMSYCVFATYHATLFSFSSCLNPPQESCCCCWWSYRRENSQCKAKFVAIQYNIPRLKCGECFILVKEKLSIFRFSVMLSTFSEGWHEDHPACGSEVLVILSLPAAPRIWVVVTWSGCGVYQTHCLSDVSYSHKELKREEFVGTGVYMSEASAIVLN